MFKFIWCVEVIVFQVVVIRSCFSTFTSELDNNLAQVNEASPLEIDVPWEFNKTISASSTVAVNASVQSNATFCLIQIHSFLHNVSILHDSGEAYGTDVGVILFPYSHKVEFLIHNPNKISVKILGFVTAYTDEAPIPGGFVPSNETAKPHLMMDLSKNMLHLSAIPALDVVVGNKDNSTSYRLYYMYTKEKDFSIDSYFDGIRTMISENQTMDEASEYKLPLLIDDTRGRINVVFAKYPGTGLFFKLVAYGMNGTSTYAIAHTFGCDYLSDRDSCIYLVNTFHRVEVIIVCVAGLVLCFCGFEWKGFELGVMTLLLVSISTYAAFYNMLTVEANIITSTGAGLFFASLAVVIVTCFKLLHVRHTITFCTFGLFFSSSLLFYVGVGDSTALRNEEIFWTMFSAIAASVFLLLYLNYNLSHYLTSSVIGSFMTVLTIDYFAGSSLKYLIFDNIRRASVENFFKAYASPPFQTPDVLLTLLLLLVALLCSVYQYYSHRRRYRSFLSQFTNNNFPPVATFSSFDETSPLLHPDFGVY